MEPKNGEGQGAPAPTTVTQETIDAIVARAVATAGTDSAKQVEFLAKNLGILNTRLSAAEAAAEAAKGGAMTAEQKAALEAFSALGKAEEITAKLERLAALEAAETERAHEGVVKEAAKLADFDAETLIFNLKAAGLLTSVVVEKGKGEDEESKAYVKKDGKKQDLVEFVEANFPARIVAAMKSGEPADKQGLPFPEQQKGGKAPKVDFLGEYLKGRYVLPSERKSA